MWPTASSLPSVEKFIVADTPGHEQYTRNMVTGASTAQVAVLLIDARQGVLTQTRRHAYLVSLVGIKHVVLAINKMDLVDYNQGTAETIEAEFRAFAEPLGFASISAIPVSALRGTTSQSAAAPWPGTGAPPFLPTWKRWMRGTIRAAAPSSQFSWSTAQTPTSGLLRDPCPRPPGRRGYASRNRLGANGGGEPHRDLRRRPSRTDRWERGHLTLNKEIDASGAT